MSTDSIFPFLEKRLPLCKQDIVRDSDSLGQQMELCDGGLQILSAKKDNHASQKPGVKKIRKQVTLVLSNHFPSLQSAKYLWL